MATNTTEKIRDKPPIAPKSENVKRVALEKRRTIHKPLQARYVQTIRMRFENASNSTGNVNYVSHFGECSELCISSVANKTT